MAESRRRRITDFHMLVLWWINLHPYHGAHEIARDMGADVQEIERLCRDLEAVGFIEPLTVH